VTTLDLFSGIGGFSLAASWVWGDDLDIAAFCERDAYCQKVLGKHWLGVHIHDDITTLDATIYRGRIDLLTGGFPCQPFSNAGKRRGAKDDRALWPEMLRVIDECRPRWIVGENVDGIIAMELDAVLSDLEDIGYSATAIVLPAACVDAPHRRARPWIVANAEGEYERSDSTRENQRSLPESGKCSVSTVGGRVWVPEPRIRRVDDGIPNRVDRTRALGNAIVPQVAADIFRAIKVIDGW
jgi:DNA (cytosine-5)-methyltransferase 1